MKVSEIRNTSRLPASGQAQTEKPAVEPDALEIRRDRGFVPDIRTIIVESRTPDPEPSQELVEALLGEGAIAFGRSRHPERPDVGGAGRGIIAYQIEGPVVGRDHPGPGQSGLPVDHDAQLHVRLLDGDPSEGQLVLFPDLGGSADVAVALRDDLRVGDGGELELLGIEELGEDFQLLGWTLRTSAIVRVPEDRLLFGDVRVLEASIDVLEIGIRDLFAA